MNPNYTNTITVYNKKNGAWEKSVLRNCFWKSEIKTAMNGTEATKANVYTVRIPKNELDRVNTPSSGSLVILGECMDDITMQSPNTMTEVLNRNKPNAFIVTAVADNTSHIVDKHYRLGG